MKDRQQDHLLDHAYDGIQEYDNPLPGWWVWLFWASVVFSVLYAMFYHFGQGESVVQQYERTMLAHYAAQSKALLAAGPITDESIAKLGSNAQMMSAAKSLFVGKCAVCHGNLGEGKIGPNLTDDYWLHGGKPTDVYKTITEGVISKGMIAWKNQLGPGEILALAAYVGSLQGTNPPNPRPPQGNKFDPAAAAVAASPATSPAAPAASGPAARPAGH